jgi:hypothetical protein
LNGHRGATACYRRDGHRPVKLPDALVDSTQAQAVVAAAARRVQAHTIIGH